ncbi:MAG: 3'(2'),5'-bisphosphate nucleotidase CysQ [Pseudomonadota bacterium]
MPAADLPLLIDAARSASRIATSFAGPTATRWDKADGAGPVTEADLAVDQYLREALLLARPDYGWLSEETEDSAARLDRDTVFIVDPIDGTRNFVEGGQTWAISIAIAHKGHVTAGVIALPLRDKLYAAAIGRGAQMNGATITARDVEIPPRVLCARPVMEERHWPSGRPEFARHYRPSLAYRLALVGQGAFEGMVTLRRSWEWDIAAGALIIAEAGGVVSDRHGAPLRFNSREAHLPGVVAAEPALHARLIAGLS